MTNKIFTNGLDRHMKNLPFSLDWQNWIQTSVEQGCDKNIIFKILLDEGFEYNHIKDVLEFKPTIPIDKIVNPTKRLEKTQEQELPKITVGTSELFLPNAQKFESDEIEFYQLDDFLNEDECEKLISLTKAEMRDSSLDYDYEPDEYYRTSSTCYFNPLNDEYVEEIDRRICAIMGIDPDFTESMQGQHYEVGQEFKSHVDYFGIEDLETSNKELGQRSYTFMIYLNDVEEGGETSFPKIQKTITPKRGQAVVWNSITSEGKSNPNTLHQAHPIKKGSKTVITKWFRTRAGLPAFLREKSEIIPNLTKAGFKKHKLPKALFNKVTKFYHDNLEAKVDEKMQGENINTIGSALVDLPQSLKDELHNSLKSRLEAWCGVKLEPTDIDGIRIYPNGATLPEHRYSADTQTISAIINIDQQVNEEWPLVIEDNYCRKHEIILRPEEIVFYEGARLFHSHPKPLNGTGFANIYCHYKPVF
jgi:prolyl 4-hydroxylase